MVIFRQQPHFDGVPIAMSTIVDNPTLKELQHTLNHHPVYQALHSLADLRHFMNCHIYSVWDFMSLVKYLQNQLAPSHYPWLPLGNADTRYFINSLVLEEESDQAPPESGIRYSSHFELYCQAMREIGADPQNILLFLNNVQTQGIDIALNSPLIPFPSQKFTRTTFAFIATHQTHVVAAALALGREHIIPTLFRAFLSRMGISQTQAPTFHYYLRRHVHLDEDFHGPLSLQMLEQLIGNSEQKRQEAEQAAEQAMLARVQFWDEVLDYLKHKS